MKSTNPADKRVCVAVIGSNGTVGYAFLTPDEADEYALGIMREAAYARRAAEAAAARWAAE